MFISYHVRIFPVKSSFSRDIGMENPLARASGKFALPYPILLMSFGAGKSSEVGKRAKRGYPLQKKPKSRRGDP
jgi:hypothetical protein